MYPVGVTVMDGEAQLNKHTPPSPLFHPSTRDDVAECDAIHVFRSNERVTLEFEGDFEGYDVGMVKGS